MSYHIADPELAEKFGPNIGKDYALGGASVFNVGRT